MIGPLRLLGPMQSGGGSTLSRQKSEVVFSDINWTIGASQSLIDSLADLEYTGSFAPFFSVLDNKFKPLNFGSVCSFKLNLIGTWDASGGNQYLVLDFPGSTGNNLVYSKSPAMDADTISITTFFSVDENGNLATNGSEIMITAPEAAFVVTDLVLIAEQMTW